jgi:hypothetical protein
MARNGSAESETISIRIHCTAPKCRRNREYHGPYSINIGRIRSYSKVLDDVIRGNPWPDRVRNEHLPDGSVRYVLLYRATLFSCHALQALVHAWMEPWEPDHQLEYEFNQLLQISKALVYFRSAPDLFLRFAAAVYHAHWDQGRNCAEWALIAVVFNWKGVFSVACCGLSNYALQNYSLVDLDPSFLLRGDGMVREIVSK